MVVKDKLNPRFGTDFSFFCESLWMTQVAALTQEPLLLSVIVGMTCCARLQSIMTSSGVPRWPLRAALKENDDTAHSFAKGQLKAIIERIEKLEEEKKAISDDIKDVYGEAKGNGFDVKALRTIIRMRKQDADERQEQETILETYMQALGML